MLLLLLFAADFLSPEQSAKAMTLPHARILIHQGRYAGTWGAPDHGGLMFGKIVKNEPSVVQ